MPRCCCITLAWPCSALCFASALCDSWYLRSVRLLLHCFYTVLTLLLYCCYTVVTLLLHSCYTVVTLLSQYCHKLVTLLLHKSALCFASALCDRWYLRREKSIRYPHKTRAQIKDMAQIKIISTYESKAEQCYIRGHPGGGPREQEFGLHGVSTLVAG
jgi:hypothetical protein